MCWSASNSRPHKHKGSGGRPIGLALLNWWMDDLFLSHRTSSNWDKWSGKVGITWITFLNCWHLVVTCRFYSYRHNAWQVSILRKPTLVNPYLISSVVLVAGNKPLQGMMHCRSYTKVTMGLISTSFLTMITSSSEGSRGRLVAIDSTSWGKVDNMSSVAILAMWYII